MLALKRIRDRRQAWLDEHGSDERIDAHHNVTTLQNGNTVKSFSTGFDGLLAECGFHYAKIEEKHTLTSLRHTYATFSLTRRRGKRASMRALAKQMGTSERMIQQHYGHDEIGDYEDELRGVE
jgi:integrase